MKKFEENLTLVSGAARGIGAAIAERLGTDGASFGLNYVTSKEDADALDECIRGNGGMRARSINRYPKSPGAGRVWLDRGI
jgi:3-oxoacyl-[acyl-carrier protein] reductase